ncbi:MAG TPA: hypothetical protein V6C89_16925 [Drouetiella sp.]|jgi:hypothetical protein
MSAEKSSKKGFAILFVGVMIGIGVGIATCVTTMVQHPASATASEKSVAIAAKAPAKPLPSLYPPPPQTASLSASYGPTPAPSPSSQPEAQTVGMNYQQSPASVYQSLVPATQSATQGTAIQSQDGSLLMPGVNAYATNNQSGMTVTSYDVTPDTITAGNVNPNWTVGRNGLLQNPCVDPPSAHGRQTGQY